MTWGELKVAIEAQGVTDETEINLIELFNWKSVDVRPALFDFEGVDITEGEED